MLDVCCTVEKTMNYVELKDIQPKNCVKQTDEEQNQKKKKERKERKNECKKEKNNKKPSRKEYWSAAECCSHDYILAMDRKTNLLPTRNYKLIEICLVRGKGKKRGEKVSF